MKPVTHHLHFNKACNVEIISDNKYRIHPNKHHPQLENLEKGQSVSLKKQNMSFDLWKQKCVAWSIIGKRILGLLTSYLLQRL